MFLTVNWDNRTGAVLPDGVEGLIAGALRIGLAGTALLRGAEISVSFVGAPEMQRINGEYRSKDCVTDVLSFPFLTRFEVTALAQSKPVRHINSRERVGRARRGHTATQPLGDIVICFPKAQAQAALYGHSLQRELAFLAVHGLLHLMGHDHEDEEEERLMRAAQAEILSEAGVAR